MKPSAMEVIAQDMNEEGVGAPTTRGAVAGYVLARVAVGLLRELHHPEHEDEPGAIYAQYRALKHPCGPGSATADSKLIARAFALKAACELALHYMKEAA